MVDHKKGKTYDTDAAKYLGSVYIGDPPDYVNTDALYLKPSGEFFLERYLGPFKGSHAVPLTHEEAKVWAETYLRADVYRETFGPEMTDEPATITVSAKTGKLLRAYAEKRHLSLYAAVDEIAHDEGELILFYEELCTDCRKAKW